LWVEKYRPKQIAEMVGNEEARIKLVSWLRNWEEGDKAALLVGPPGTGKTTLVHLAADECGAFLIELNASDTRTKDKLGKKVGEALSTTSLFETRSLIFLDEVDGLAGRADYGAVEFIKEAVKRSKNPVVMAANDPDSEQVKKLSSVCVLITFKPPPPREIELFLGHILNEEGISVSSEALVEIVRNSRGDMRHAINSLQSNRQGAANDEKNLTMSVSQSIGSFFSAEGVSKALAALRETPLAPHEKVREIFRCVVKSSLSPQKMKEATEVLSKADMLMGKIRKGKNWRILRYLDATLASELWPIIHGEGLAYSEGDLPWNMLLRVWNDSRKFGELAARYSASAHTSSRSARVQDIPFLVYMSGAKKFKDSIIQTLGLDETFEKFLAKEARVVRG
jgi:replication factor C large subunit